MSIAVSCHNCGREWQLHDSHAGQLALCPTCAEEVTVPVAAGTGPAAGAFSPASLPGMSVVEFIDLAGDDLPQAATRLRDHAGTPGVRLEGEAAARLADLWRKLPPGVVLVTHFPTYGLRFLDGDRLLGWASICVAGQSIRGEFGGEPVEYSFDSWHPDAMALLQELQGHTKTH